MFAIATESQRHPALINAQPAAPLARAGAKPCLDPAGMRANDSLGGDRPLRCGMWNDIKDQFGSRGLRGVEVEVLTRRVPW